MTPGRIISAAACVFVIGGCGDNTPGNDRQGGATTVDDRTINAFTHPAANLTSDQQDEFQAGKGPFDFHWEIPQLGPLFNNDACFGCHGSNGRGLSQIGPGGAVDINGSMSESLIRVSMPTGTPDFPGGPVDVPGLGTQLHDHSTVGLPQIAVMLSWMEQDGMYGDGTPFTLRQPSLDVMLAAGGPLPDGTLQSYRQAPPVIGLGLLEAVPEATIEAMEDPDDANGDGISGHRNQVWDPQNQVTVTGRFGWKANTPTLVDQAAGAALNDMGLTNEVFPASDGTTDVSDSQMDQITFMVSTIGVPAAAPLDGLALEGRDLFDQFQCSSCHVPTLVTGAHPIAQVAYQTIHPYTDLLLHDMGPGLADNRPDYLATGSEWRTPPLWGIGIAQLVQPGVTFMHDGRARTLEEAILWHGGEAAAASEDFRTASQTDRDALLAFLAAL